MRVGFKILLRLPGRRNHVLSLLRARRLSGKGRRVHASRFTYREENARKHDAAARFIITTTIIAHSDNILY